MSDEFDYRIAWHTLAGYLSASDLDQGQLAAAFVYAVRQGAGLGRL